MAKSTVALAQETNPSKALSSIDKLLGFKIKKDSTILVKPNANTADPPPGSTDPELVSAVVKLLYKKGASRVIVGDSSTVMLFRKSRDTLRKTGIEAAALEAGAEVVSFNEKPFRKVHPAQARSWPLGFSVSSVLGEADAIVNLAICKTHFIAGFTMSLKNIVGCTGFFDRMKLHTGPHIGARIAELNLAWTPALNILDARKVFISGGPDKGKLAEPGLLLASSDRVALDAVGVAVLRTHGAKLESPWCSEQLCRASELGLGAKSWKEIAIKSSKAGKIEEIKKNLQ